MRRFSDFTQVFGLEGGSALTIGNFDGVHLGHRALLNRVRSYAAAEGLSAAVLTFDPHPVRILAPALAPLAICSTPEKLRLLEEAGVDAVLVQAFDLEFARLDPETFIQRVLVDALHARVVVVGYDFTFGARRAGTTEVLRSAGAHHGFRVEVVSAQAVGTGLVASSTKVREFVLEGRVEGAALVLGRPFSLMGTVRVGAQRGRTLGFPTANLAVDGELQPHTGVYAGWLDWGVGPRPAVINVGHNPTFREAAGLPGVEVHVMGETDLDLYGRKCRLFFAERLREERRFDGVQALVAQITRDRNTAATLLAARTAPAAAPLPA